MKANETISKFVEGKTYEGSENYMCHFPYTVIRRTEKTVWLKDEVLGNELRRKVQVDQYGEYIESGELFIRPEN